VRAFCPVALAIDKLYSARLPASRPAGWLYMTLEIARSKARKSFQ